MATVNVCETFVSIQGESTYAGATCFFIRLTECNLRCTYCDTKYAYSLGKEVKVGELVAQCRESFAQIVQITGGEPLLQAGFPELARELQSRSGKTVLVETNGSRDISVIPEGVIAVMDIKCPGSGEVKAMDWKNIQRLRPQDEVKFVLLDRKDYEYAAEIVREQELARHCKTILFSPVFDKLAPGMLAKWICEDGLPVRIQIQLHKYIGAR